MAAPAPTRRPPRARPPGAPGRRSWSSRRHGPASSAGLRAGGPAPPPGTAPSAHRVDARAANTTKRETRWRCESTRRSWSPASPAGCASHTAPRIASPATRAPPRGRIAAMRAVQHGTARLDAEFTRYMDECVQCRACEAVCPSSVQFGHLMAGARETLTAETRYVPRWQRLGYRVYPPPAAGRRLASAGRGPAAARRAVSGVAAASPAATRAARHRRRRLALHRLRHGRVAAAGPRRGDPRPRGGRRRRLAAQARGAACCGALHHHAGLGDDARAIARRVIPRPPGMRRSSSTRRGAAPH